jgi:GNAT superfamily N-acetyltransferase
LTEPIPLASPAPRLPQSLWFRHAAGPEGIVDDVAVDDARVEHQKQGIGGRILDFAVIYAREQLGASVVGLSLDAANEAARRLYTSRGFIAWGVAPRAMRVGDDFRDEIHMALTLS